MPSEIDDIFAAKGAKGKGKAVDQPVPSTSTTVAPKKKKKGKKKPVDSAEHTRLASADDQDGEPSSKKRPVPETFIDPSVHIPNPKRVKVTDDAAKVKVKVKKGAEKEKDDQQRFTDSRGSGPRKLVVSPSTWELCLFSITGKKTEEGWSVYKEDELGIRDEGGGKLIMILFTLWRKYCLPQKLPFVRSIVNAVSLLSILPSQPAHRSRRFLSLGSMKTKFTCKCVTLFPNGSFEASQIASATALTQ